jgi:tetratricopeptide (TPR) repeat protein
LPALLNLGNLHEDRGNREEAEAAYRRVLDVAPDNALALSRLASMSHAAEFEPQLRAALSRPEVPASERADLGFALAGLLDAAGRHEEAFEAARGANDASRAATGARYDRADVEARIDALMEAFNSPATGTSDLQAPVFILGMFRSGSTLIEQILDGHGGIHAGGELDLIPELVRTIADYPRSAARADEATVGSWRRFYLDGLQPIARDAALIIDKRPDNFLHVGLIKRLFPHAKIIQTRRNRLDNLLSLYFLHLDPDMAYALDLADAAHWYGQYERLMAHWKSLYSNDIFEVNYDELVRSPEPLVESLLAFLGLEPEDGMLDFSTKDRPVRTASVWQVRKPLHATSSGRSRNYASQLKAVLGDEAY